LGIGDNESFKAASALAGGVARQGETCGAVIGALSALGLIIGRDKIEDTTRYRAGMDTAGKMRRKFMDEIAAQFGLSAPLENTLCRHIHLAIYGRSYDLTKNEDFQAFLKAGGHGDNGCPKVCAIAAQVAAEQITTLQG
jgi:hypothetical protein